MILLHTMLFTSVTVAVVVNVTFVSHNDEERLVFILGSFSVVSISVSCLKHAVIPNAPRWPIDKDSASNHIFRW